MSFLWRLRCPGSCSVDDSLGSGWDFVIHRSYCLYSSLCSFLGWALCSYLYLWGLGCYSSIKGRLMNCIVRCFVLEGVGYSTEDVVVEG